MPHDTYSYSGTQIVGIGGASGSGKSCVARELSAALNAPVLELDSYYRDLAHLPLDERARWNFDHPEALDWELLREHLGRLSAGLPIAVPVYDFATHTRASHTWTVAPAPFVVIEGIFALYDPEVRQQLAVGVFMELDDATCLERRSARDIAERGRTRESVLSQFFETVLPMYRRFIEPTRWHADLVLRGDAPLSDSAASVLALLALPEMPVPEAAESAPEGQQLPENEPADL